MTKDEQELEEFKVIYSALDDCRRLIAAGKVQRWDVVKWGVTVNVALATATAVIRFNVAFSSISFALAVLEGERSRLRAALLALRDLCDSI